MYGREELEKHCTTMRGWYFADDADKVMDAMETRIKELEAVISKMETTPSAPTTEEK